MELSLLILTIFYMQPKTVPLCSVQPGQARGLVVNGPEQTGVRVPQEPSMRLGPQTEHCFTCCY